MSNLEWKSEKRLLTDLRASPTKFNLINIKLLTTTMLYGIIGICEILILYVNNAIKHLLAKRFAKAEPPVFVHANAMQSLSHILKSAYFVVKNFTTTKTNIFVQWFVQVSIKKAKTFQKTIARLFQKPGEGNSNLINIHGGKATMSDMAHCTNGFIEFLAHQWFAKVVEAKNLLINKSTGLTGVESISVMSMTGYAYA